MAGSCFSVDVCSRGKREIQIELRTCRGLASASALAVANGNTSRRRPMKWTDIQTRDVIEIGEKMVVNSYRMLQVRGAAS